MKYILSIFEQSKKRMNRLHDALGAFDLSNGELSKPANPILNWKKMLTKAMRANNTVRVSAQSDTGTYYPREKHKGAQRHSMTLFCARQIMASRAWGRFGGPVTFVSGGSNPAFRLAALITTQFGKSPDHTRETAMSSHIQVAPGTGASTPEDYFRIPCGTPKELNIDALLTALSRAGSIIRLLQSDGENLKEGFQSCHETVMDSLWCVDGLIQQAQKIAQYPLSKGSANE